MAPARDQIIQRWTTPPKGEKEGEGRGRGEGRRGGIIPRSSIALDLQSMGT